jgi:hypothetical protein
MLTYYYLPNDTLAIFDFSFNLLSSIILLQLTAYRLLLIGLFTSSSYISSIALYSTLNLNVNLLSSLLKNLFNKIA